MLLIIATLVIHIHIIDSVELKQRRRPICVQRYRWYSRYKILSDVNYHIRILMNKHEVSFCIFIKTNLEQNKVIRGALPFLIKDDAFTLSIPLRTTINQLAIKESDAISLNKAKLLFFLVLGTRNIERIINIPLLIIAANYELERVQAVDISTDTRRLVF